MIPRFRPALGWGELRALFSRGGSENILDFERRFALKMGQRHAVAFPYGRTGLMLLLEALGIRDKEIICPAYTCVVVPHAIVKSGNRPVFIDSQANDCNMDLDFAERAIGSNTAALIATSIFGHPVDLERLEQMAARHPDLVIIQDCAHSFAAEWRGSPVQQAGQAAIFGLNISKIANSIFGGMVTTDDDGLAMRLRELRAELLKPAPLVKSLSRALYLMAVVIAFNPIVYGVVRWLERISVLDRFSRYYDENVIDLPDDALVAMTPLEARVGIVQIEKYCAMIDARRKWAEFYREHLAALAGITFPVIESGATWSHVVAGVTDRDTLVRQTEERGVQLGVVIDYNIPEMAAYRDGRSVQEVWPFAAGFARTTINLPVGGVFNVREARRVVEVVSQCLKNER